MKRLYHQWTSKSLGRKMEILVFGDQGARVLVFPPRVGKFYDYENKGMVEALSESIERGHVQLFCLDSVDDESFYCNWKSPRSRIERHLEYERYVLDEVVPFSNDINPNSCLVAHGCSLGAFHAVNLALRHPACFNRLIAFSGRYDLTASLPDFYDLFEGYYDLDVYYNTPSHFVPNLSDEDLLGAMRRMEIILTIGDEDPFLENNRALSLALTEKKVNHSLHVWSGRAHRFQAWRQMVHWYL